MSAVSGAVTFAFDRRGAWVALAWFLAPVALFGVILLINLRRGRPGRFRLSGPLRAWAFAVLVLAYCGVLYDWLFWRTFYDLSLAAGQRRIDLTFLLPERSLSLPLAELATIGQEPGPKGLGRRLLIQTRDGTTYRSPVRSRQEIAEILSRLQGLGAQTATATAITDPVSFPFPSPAPSRRCAVRQPGPPPRSPEKMACLRRIAGLRGRFDSFLLVNCVENYLELTDEEVVELVALRARKENREVQAMALTWSEKLEAKGETKGRGEGAREILLLLLAERFGPLPEGARRQVEEISSFQRLTQLAKRVLTAHSLEEMDLA